MGLYGIAQGHCWIVIDDDGHGVWARLYTFYGILWVAILYITFVFCKLKCHGNNTEPIIKNIKFFPFALIMGYVPATSKRFYDLLNMNNPRVEFGFQCAMYSGLMLVGFFDGIWYGWIWYSGHAHSPYGPTIQSHTNGNTDTSGDSTYPHSHIDSSEMDVAMV